MFCHLITVFILHSKGAADSDDDEDFSGDVGGGLDRTSGQYGATSAGGYWGTSGRSTSRVVSPTFNDNVCIE